MDNPRIYLWIALALLVWANVIQWNNDYGAAAPTAADGSQPATPAVAGTPQAETQLPALPTGGAEAPAGPAAPEQGAPQAQIRVLTDVLDLDISLQGGSLVRADLPTYPRDRKQDSPPVRLLSTADADYHVVRSGLRAAGGGAEPTHLAAFTSPAQEYRLAAGQDELRVPLSWTDGQGVSVTKTYVLRRGSYAIDVEYTVQNASAAPWQAASYVQLAHHVYSQDRKSVV